MRDPQTWIVLGSSTTAPKAFTAAKADYPGATVITTNSGLLLTVPDYYYIDDIKACCEFYRQANRIQERCGTKLVVQRHMAGSLLGNNLNHPDLMLEVDPDNTYMGFDGKGYSQVALSGLMCIQVALLSGARTLVLPGHEGYPLEGDHMVLPGWDKPQRTMKLTNSRYQTQNMIAPWFRQTVKLFPQTQFIFYGDLRYELDGPNVEKISADDVDQRLWAQNTEACFANTDA